MDAIFSQRLFHIEEDQEGCIRRKFHSTLSSRFRSFKARLVSDYLRDEIDMLDLQEFWESEGASMQSTSSGTKNYRPPWVRYEGAITEEQWQRFRASRLTRDARVSVCLIIFN